MLDLLLADQMGIMNFGPNLVSLDMLVRELHLLADGDQIWRWPLTVVQQFENISELIALGSFLPSMPQSSNRHANSNANQIH